MHLRKSSSSGKNVEEPQVPPLATLLRVPRDEVIEPSNGTLSLIGAFSIMTNGNKDIIIPGMSILMLTPSHSTDYLTLQALLRLGG